jgi:hypothetical protein
MHRGKDHRKLIFTEGLQQRNNPLLCEVATQAGTKMALCSIPAMSRNEKKTP